MKLTRTKLRQLIKEELRVLLEVKVDPGIDNIRIGAPQDDIGNHYTLQVYGPGSTPKDDGGKGPTGQWRSRSGQQHIDKAREHILYLLDKYPNASVTMLMSSNYGYTESWWGKQLCDAEPGGCGEDKLPGREYRAPKEVLELVKEF